MDYQKLYYILFNAMTDVLEQLEQQNFGAAKALLVKAQQTAEEDYLETEEGRLDTEQTAAGEVQPDMEEALLAAGG